VDDDIRSIKGAINERFNDLFGFDMQVDDPLEPTKIGSGVTIQGKQVGTPIFNAGNSGSAKTIDWDNGDQQRVTMTANCTFTFTNVVAGRSYQLFLVQDSSGGRVASFPSTVFQSGGAAFGTPPLTLTANRHSLIALSCFSTAVQVGTVVYTGVPIT
jgi:hypothetical protein